MVGGFKDGQVGTFGKVFPFGLAMSDMGVSNEWLIRGL